MGLIRGSNKKLNETDLKKFYKPTKKNTLSISPPLLLIYLNTQQTINFILLQKKMYLFKVAAALVLALCAISSANDATATAAATQKQTKDKTVSCF